MPTRPPAWHQLSRLAQCNARQLLCSRLQPNSNKPVLMYQPPPRTDQRMEHGQAVLTVRGEANLERLRQVRPDVVVVLLLRPLLPLLLPPPLLGAMQTFY